MIYYLVYGNENNFKVQEFNCIDQLTEYLKSCVINKYDDYIVVSGNITLISENTLLFNFNKGDENDKTSTCKTYIK